MTRTIPRSVARCLVGAKLYAVLAHTPERYETVLVEPEGVKLFRKREGRRVTWGVYGYAHDGSDLRRALARCGGR